MEYESFKELDLEKEEKILLFIARRKLEINTKSEKLPKITDQIDWYYLLQLCYKHGLPVQLYLYLKSMPPGVCPREIYSHLEDFFKFNEEMNQLHTTELLRISELLNTNNIFALPYLGVILANTSYKSCHLRTFNSVDFYIKKSDALKVKDLIISLGYKQICKTDFLDDESYVNNLEEFRFFGEKVNLNVRWNFSYKFHFPVKTFYDKKEFVKILINQQHILTFSPEDFFLILCIHNANHRWSQLDFICDLREFMATNDLKWDKIKYKANKIGIERILAINLVLVHILLNTRIPAGLISLDQNAPQISKEIIEKFILKKNLTIMENLKLSIKIREKLIDGILDFLSIIFIPSLTDLNQISAPKILSPLINVSRPFILFKKYYKNKFQPHPGKFEPSTRKVVELMLHMAEISSDDIVYDLGCGDGRIVVSAALDYRARGVGIDLDPGRIEEAKLNARKEGVSDLVTFRQEDINDSDISKASVVCLFLRGSFLNNFKDKLKKELSPGTRIVSNEHEIRGWHPVKKEYLVDKRVHTIYLYEI